MLYVDARGDYLMVKAYKKLFRLPIATCEIDGDFYELKYTTIFSNRILGIYRGDFNLSVGGNRL